MRRDFESPIPQKSPPSGGPSGKDQVGGCLVEVTLPGVRLLAAGVPAFSRVVRRLTGWSRANLQRWTWQSS